MSWFQALSDTIDFLSRAASLSRAVSERRMTPEEQSAAVREFLLQAPRRVVSNRPAQTVDRLVAAQGSGAA